MGAPDCLPGCRWTENRPVVSGAPSLPQQVDDVCRCPERRWVGRRPITSVRVTVRVVLCNGCGANIIGRVHVWTISKPRWSSPAGSKRATRIKDTSSGQLCGTSRTPTTSAFCNPMARVRPYGLGSRFQQLPLQVRSLGRVCGWLCDVQPVHVGLGHHLTILRSQVVLCALGLRCLPPLHACDQVWCVDPGSQCSCLRVAESRVDFPILLLAE